jgi:hypothetical protein
LIPGPNARGKDDVLEPVTAVQTGLVQESPFNALVLRIFDAHAADLQSQLGDDVPWYHWWKKVRLWFQIRVTNGLGILHVTSLKTLY